MITVNLVQGTPEWHQHRSNHFNASDAPAMLGVSKYKSRDQLLHEMATGLTKEIDAATQKRFDDGHKFESLARPLAEKIIGDELSPLVATKGKLSASFDGITFAGDVIFEHKTLNDELRKAEFDNDGNYLSQMYRAQMEQQLMISGAEKCLFMASTWDKNDQLIEERHCWYLSDQVLRTQIVQGWCQFAEDLKSYVPPVKIEKVVAETIETLPVPSVVVRGEITASNLSDIAPKFDAYLGSINTQLSTDQDFADAEANAKNCRETEKRIEALRANIIAQMIEVNEVDSALANYQEAFRKSAIQLEKAVKEQKELIKTNAIMKAKNEYIAFLNDVEKDLPVRIQIKLAAPNFAEAIKGIKTIESMHSRLNDAVANGKAEATALLNTVKCNIELINSLSKGIEHIVNVQLEQLAFANEDYIHLYIANVRRDEDARIAQIKAKAEAEAIAKVEADKLAKEKLAEKEAIAFYQAQYEADLLKPVEVKASPSELRAAVVENQDDISTFLKSRNFTDAKYNEYRAVLVEFVKYQAANHLGKAA